jgi:hypothetical protein
MAGLEKTGTEVLKPDGKKTSRTVSPEAKRKEQRNPLARTGLRHKSWRKW